MSQNPVPFILFESLRNQTWPLGEPLTLGPHESKTLSGRLDVTMRDAPVPQLGHTEWALAVRRLIFDGSDPASVLITEIRRNGVPFAIGATGIPLTLFSADNPRFGTIFERVATQVVVFDVTLLNVSDRELTVTGHVAYDLYSRPALYNHNYWGLGASDVAPGASCTLAPSVIPAEPRRVYRIERLVLNAAVFGAGFDPGKNLSDVVVTELRFSGKDDEGVVVEDVLDVEVPITLFHQYHKGFGISLPRREWREVAVTVTARNDRQETVNVSGALVYSGGVTPDIPFEAGTTPDLPTA